MRFPIGIIMYQRTTRKSSNDRKLRASEYHWRQSISCQETPLSARYDCPRDAEHKRAVRTARSTQLEVSGAERLQGGANSNVHAEMGAHPSDLDQSIILLFGAHLVVCQFLSLSFPCFIHKTNQIMASSSGRHWILFG